jgi:hypothetical protein
MWMGANDIRKEGQFKWVSNGQRLEATIKRNSQRVGLVQQEVIIISSRVTCSRHDIAEILFCC